MDDIGFLDKVLCGTFVISYIFSERLRLARSSARDVCRKNKIFILLHLSEAASHLVGDGENAKNQSKSHSAKKRAHTRTDHG
jgi:hypothetical protein